MQKYTLLFKEKNHFDKETLIFFKNSFSKQKRINSEILMLHIFLTKDDVERSIKRSFTDINIENPNNKRRLFDNKYQSRLLTIQNLMLFMSSSIKNSPNITESFAKFMTINSQNPLSFNKYGSEKYRVNYYENNVSNFNHYLIGLHLSHEELFTVFGRIASYFMYLLKELRVPIFHSEYLVKTFDKYKKSRSEKELLSIINKTHGFLEKRIHNSYNIKKEHNVRKFPLIYQYVIDRRLYKRILWRDVQKPYYYHYAPKFFNAFFSVKNLINPESFYCFSRSDLNLFLTLISIELIINTKISKLTQK